MSSIVTARSAPSATIDVRSPYGTTRVNVCGPQGAPALVLLHGGGATSAAWSRVIPELARSHRIYAPDQPGGPGRSVVGVAPIDTRADLRAWLDALLDGLGLAHPALCGHSYGACLAVSYAAHAPSRVSRLVLLDPTDCFAGLALRYRLRAVPLFARPTPQRLRAFLQWETAGSMTRGRSRRGSLGISRTPRWRRRRVPSHDPD